MDVVVRERSIETYKNIRSAPLNPLQGESVAKNVTRVSNNRQAIRVFCKYIL